MAPIQYTKRGTLRHLSREFYLLYFWRLFGRVQEGVHCEVLYRKHLSEAGPEPGKFSSFGFDSGSLRVLLEVLLEAPAYASPLDCLVTGKQSSANNRLVCPRECLKGSSGGLMPK
jgi:hypothetical protein